MERERKMSEATEEDILKVRIVVWKILFMREKRRWMD